MKKAFKNKGILVGGGIVVSFIILAIFAPLIAPYNPKDADLMRSLEPPQLKYPFGTDVQGRDILSRIIFGSRVSLSVGLVVQAISLSIGIPLGLISGFYGGIADDIITSLINIMFSFPSLLFAIAIMAVLGPSIYNIYLALGIISWPTVARLVRGETLSLKERDFVEASKALGVHNFSIIFKHILPNCLGPIIVVATLGIADAILTEATLSFLGLGVQPPTPSWGSMLSRGREYIWSAPHLVIFPGLAILITVLGFNLLGDGLRDIFDPKLKNIK